MNRSILAIFIIVVAAYCTNLKAQETALTSGFNHIGLTVSDLNASSQFFINTLGWKKVGGDDDYPSIFVSDGKMVLTLWLSTKGKNATQFNRKTNVGLHHLAFTVLSEDGLNKIYEKVKTVKGVVIEFAPEFAYGGPAKHMMIREPSGNRLEFMFKPAL